METMTIVLSAISLIISILAVVVSYYSFQRTLKTTIKPVLVFSRRSETLWQIQNVGSGPAISLIIGGADRKGNWSTIANYYPLSAGASVSLPWLLFYEIAAVYTDIHGGTFTTHCKNNKNTLSEKNNYPNWKPTHEEWFFFMFSPQDEENYVKESDLEGKSASELDMMRNEIFARHGFIFRRQDLAEYFSKQEWYTPTENNHKAVLEQLSPSERYNAYFILNYQSCNNLMNTDDVVAP